MDPFHLQYIIDGKESIVCENVLFEHIPFLHGLTKDLKEMANARVVRKQDLNYWFDLHNFKVIFDFFLYNSNFKYINIYYAF